MTEQEKQINSVEKRVDTLEAVFKSFMQEMRDRDNQRANDIKELRQKQEADMKEIRQKQEADMKEIRTSISNMQNNIEGMGKHVRNVSVVAMVGVGGMFIAVGVMVGTIMIYTILSR